MGPQLSLDGARRGVAARYRSGSLRSEVAGSSSAGPTTNYLLVGTKLGFAFKAQPWRPAVSGVAGFPGSRVTGRFRGSTPPPRPGVPAASQSTPRRSCRPCGPGPDVASQHNEKPRQSSRSRRAGNNARAREPDLHRVHGRHARPADTDLPLYRRPGCRRFRRQRQVGSRVRPDRRQSEHIPHLRQLMQQPRRTARTITARPGSSTQVMMVRVGVLRGGM